MKTFRCTTDAETQSGFHKGKTYFFDTRYGLMTNHEFRDFYFNIPSDHGFVEISNPIVVAYTHVVYFLCLLKTIY